jgi:hypothetical protein
MIKNYFYTENFLIKYWNFLDKLNFKVSFIFSFFFTWNFFNKDVGELLIWSIQWVIYPLILLPLLTPKIVNFCKEKQWKDKEKMNKVYNWCLFFSRIYLICFFHFFSLFCFLILCVKLNMQLNLLY